MTIDNLKNRLARTTQKHKDPRYWPFCISCHLAAPEHAMLPLDHYDITKGKAPDVQHWSMFTNPTAGGSKEQHHLCPDCASFVVVQLVRHHKAVVKKLTGIQAQLSKGPTCGLRLTGHLNPFQSAFCGKAKGHTDACGPSRR